MGVRDEKNFHTKDREVNVMPSVETIECERVAYINEMKEYLKNLKNMDRGQARKMSLDNLVKSRIIGENGEFTEHYGHTKASAQKKG